MADGRAERVAITTASYVEFEMGTVLENAPCSRLCGICSLLNLIRFSLPLDDDGKMSSSLDDDDELQMAYELLEKRL